MMRTYNLCIAGFGNVGQALVRLLLDKTEELRRDCAIEWRITGLASRRLGWIAEAQGLDPLQILDPEWRAAANRAHSASSAASPSSSDAVREWLRQAKADVLFETSSLNRHTGQPAIDYLRAALESGAHAISANKGPVVFAYQELRQLAQRQGKRFLFESTVMDGVPIFSLKDALPAAQVRGFRGILNSTTNIVLGEIEAGLSLEQAVRKAQELGIAETDPSDDLDGWDAAVKVAALSTVLLEHPLRLDEISVQGIRGLEPEQVRAARREGRPYKLVCAATKDGKGIRAGVAPRQLTLSDPMAHVDGSSSAVHFELDILPGLTVFEQDPGLVTTAYGLLADFIRAVRKT